MPPRASTLVAKPAAAKSTSWEKGAKVLFNHPVHSWVIGNIKDIDEKKQTNKIPTPYLCSSQGVEDAWVTESDLNMYKEDILTAVNDDLLDLIELNESSLLYCVQNRFKEDKIYTFIGGLIISLNPFKWTIPYCKDEFMINYVERKKGLNPHCWQIADRAYRAMKGGEGNQTLLISGESGAGKTEACKSVIKYLCKLSSTMTNDPNVKSVADGMSSKIQQASPILEAFGNAKTKNNDNSSRFGKFIKLQFDSHGIIKGAVTENYLLEKSRLMKQGPNERSYHIFYQMLAGMDEAKKKELFLTKAQDYDSIMKGNCFKVDTIDDVSDFHAMVNAFKVIGFEDEIRDTVFKVCAAILHLQNIKFVKIPNEDTGSTLENDEPLKKACTLLQIEPAALKKALTVKTYAVMAKIFESPLTPEAASDSRDALSKNLYSNMFDWLVAKINDNTNSNDYTSFIGLLDIFGFEKFEFNTFEQFCINFANEALQAHYNSYTFKRDKKECENEGIDVTEVTFKDNQPCLDMIQGSKSGILKVLDDQSALQSATDQKFFEMITQTYKSHEYFIHAPLWKEEFAVKHYAGEVKYNIKDWIEKNKDILRDDIIDIISQSKIEFVAKTICPEKKDFTSNKKDKKPSTVTGSFKKQLIELLDLINSTSPHWIRTIKPHPAKKPGLFSNAEVVKQLNSSGVLETIRIRKEGYSVRIPHELFFNKYNVIIGEGSSTDFKSSSEKIISSLSLGKDKVQVGKTKVFLKSDTYKMLESARNKKLEKYIIKMQRVGRGFLGRCVARKIREQIRIKKEKEEYEKNKEIFERILQDKKEREKIEQEKREKEEKERREREEKEREERERIEKLRVEQEKIEREKREAKELEKRKLEILKAKQKERMLELQRIEREKLEKERAEKEQQEKERIKMEEERKALLKEELERRKASLIERENQRLAVEKQQRIQERREQMEARRREKERVELEAEKRKQSAVEKLDLEKKSKQQKDQDLLRVAETARIKLEQERLDWEKKQWESIMQEILREEQQKLFKKELEKQKLRKVEESEKVKQQQHLKKAVLMYDREKKAIARKALIRAEKDDMIQCKKEYLEQQKRKLLQKKQEEEVQVIEKQAHLQWEVDKEKRREEIRKTLLQKIRNEKSREIWREVDNEKKERSKRLEYERQMWEMERQLQIESEDLNKKFQNTKLEQKAQLQQDYLVNKKEQEEYEYQLQKLKQKITGVFSAGPMNVSSSSMDMSKSLVDGIPVMSPRSPGLNTSSLTASPLDNISFSRDTPSPIQKARPMSSQTPGSASNNNRIPVKKGLFSKLY
ncbi:myosin [Naegleria gruberi]|uniref:Myosin n=1 Tax=Naegleria gruberi TaxID=5762 RepID=D2V4T1_NAEGR|nr:myosin [Naegleria gruberi]EFC48154.1 myosin [Naegleria gruberi]|eukprot:XP_002680898.1 myosin [Naegleria gruberi]